VNPTITITFNSEGGSAVTSQSGPAGTTITLPAAPTYAGYNFDGWFLAASGGTALTSPYTLTTSLTLFAQWSAIIIAPPTPTVSITNLPSAATYGGQFTPSYMTSGNGTVFSVTSSTTSVCTVSGSVVNFVGVGQCTLNAHVADTTSFGGGTGAAQSFMVGAATATVSITNLPTSAQKGGQFTPSYTTSGDGTVFSVTSTSTSVCAVSGSSVSFVGAGTCNLTAAVAAPVSMLATPAPQEAGVQVRVYDKNHKDYHNWDDNENRAWGAYLTENHRSPHEYARANKKEQSQYWNWRHSHPDDRDHDRH